MARQRGNRWQADVVLPSGDRQRKSFATQAEAEAYENAVAGGFNPTLASTLGEFVDEVFDDLWGDARSRSYIEGNWRIIYGYIPRTTLLDKIDDTTLDDLVRKMKRDGKKGGTINRKLANLNKVLKEAVRRKRKQAVPSTKRQKEANARELVLTRDQELATEQFFLHIGKPVAWHLVRFLLYTGCRMNEALTLGRDRVSGKSVTFHHSLVKNGVTRTVPLVPQAADAWKAVCKLSESETPFGSLMPYWTFRDHWDALRRHLRVNSPEFVPHMLRHTCATRLVLAGVPLPMVMKWLGHKSIQVTMRYTNLVPNDLDVAARALAEAA